MRGDGINITQDTINRTNEPISGVTPSWLLSIKEVMRRVALSKSTIYAYMSAGRFPKGHKVGAKRRAWLESGVEMWMPHCSSHSEGGD